MMVTSVVINPRLCSSCGPFSSAYYFGFWKHFITNLRRGCVFQRNTSQGNIMWSIPHFNRIRILIRFTLPECRDYSQFSKLWRRKMLHSESFGKRQLYWKKFYWKTGNVLYDQIIQMSSMEWEAREAEKEVSASQGKNFERTLGWAQ